MQSLILSKLPASKSSKTNQVRINGGVWRSRLLKFPDVEGLRPTPERVRQTVFNWLGQDLTGKTCLDLFAGTGAFGFEALSRNAKNVVMVENSGLAYQSLIQNQQLLTAKNSQILRQDVLVFLSQNAQQFDVIFCDPPYHKAWLDKILPTLNQHISPDGLVYIEAEFALESSDLLSGWQLIKQNKAGNVYYHLLKSA
ncbi:MAG: 16S rRNA (guanine(966)-N(2))-methyltransferase RsmD [Methylotenera sp.]|nr:MAG: 16S rRNA (guanine(966)-N(2))-methyltransferase RsmD [Methylotenera sp.]